MEQRSGRLIWLPVLFGSVFAPVSAEATTIQVSWTFVNKEVAPLQVTYRTPLTTYFVVNPEAITDSNNVTARLNETRSGQSGFGVGYKVRYGLKRGALSKTIHIAGANLRVTVVPQGSGCSAMVQYFKSPGKQYFETERVSTHETMVESDQHAEGVTCQVNG